MGGVYGSVLNTGNITEVNRDIRGIEDRRPLHRLKKEIGRMKNAVAGKSDKDISNPSLIRNNPWILKLQKYCGNRKNSRECCRKSGDISVYYLQV